MQFAARLADRGFTLDIEAFRELDTPTARGAYGIRTAQGAAQCRIAGNRQAQKSRRGYSRTAAASPRNGRPDRRSSTRRGEQLDEKFRQLMARDSRIRRTNRCPRRQSASDNVESPPLGHAAEFAFHSQGALGPGPELGILDFDRAAKITGARFRVYWGLGAKLERALINFMLDVHTREHGYTEVLPPFMATRHSFYGTGQLPKFERRSSFKLEGTDYYLVPRPPKFRSPICIATKRWTCDTLPIKLCAYTPCFRSEAGSYGRDVRGIIRQHQFQKVELVKFTLPE